MVFDGLGPQYGSWQATTGKCSPRLQKERITMQGVPPTLQVLAWVILATLGVFIVVHTVIRLVRHFIHFRTLTNPYPKTPAMAAGITNRIWAVEDIVGLID